MKDRRLSASAQAENRELARQIANAKEFSASIRLGPADKRTLRDFPNYSAARAAADDLNKASRFGRRAVVYAINSLGSFPVDDHLLALAREMSPGAPALA